MNNPNISVIIPVYNSEKYIEQTLKSVLNQSYQSLEIICINDDSTDKSKEIIKNLQKTDNRIKLINLDKNIGSPGKVRNIGVQKANGEIIAFLDSDDIWKPNKLKTQIKNMRNINSSFSYTKLINFNEKISYEPKYILRLFKKWHIGNMLIDNTVTTSTVLISKDLFNKVGGFRNSKMKVSEDYELWIKGILTSKDIIFIDEVLTEYRVNENSITNSKISFIDIYLNILIIAKDMIFSRNMKYLLFGIVRILTLPLLVVYHILIKIRGVLQK